MPGVDDTERSSILDISSYDLTLDLTGSPETFRSRTKISFRCREPGAATFADLQSLSIQHAALNGTVLNGTVLNGTVLNGTALNGAGLGVTFGNGRLELPRLQNENVLVVEAEFAYATATQGLHHAADVTDGSAFVYANTSSGGAPRIYCCFDQPDLRAPFTVSMRAPAGWSCLANAPMPARSPAGEPGLWRFAPTAPIPPWLARFCAGPFRQPATPAAPKATPAAPLPVTVQALPSAAARLTSLHIPELLEQPLRFYERTLGPFPYDKLDLVFGPVTPDLAYSVPGLIVIHDEVLKAEAETALYLPTVLAHELAHEWFGSLVTMPPEQRWLDEALTTYISRTALAEIIPGANPWEAASLPDDSYAADAAVIRQLEDLIGRPAVIDGLRIMLTRHAHAQATVADLVTCWSQAGDRDLLGWAEQSLSPGAR